MATLADTFTAYIKPSLDGRLVLRKRTSNQTSSRVAASQRRVEDAKPSVRAHEACVAAGESRKMRMYIPGLGYQERDVCPIKTMKRHLRNAMRSAHGGAGIPGVGGR